MADTPVEIDQFSAAVSDILGEVDNAAKGAVNKALEQSTRKGAKTVRKYAEKGGRNVWSPEYVKGFSSRVTRGSGLSTGEIGNKAKPGLVHLLEKGHNTLTGRRTNAYPHLTPAFGDISKDFVSRVKKTVDAALGG